MFKGKLSFRDALFQPEKLSVTWELVPGRGAREKSQEYVMKMAEFATKDSRINGITITDNPGGKPAILAYTLAVEAQKLGIEQIVHFTSKDKNRNAIESELYALARSGIHNLLVMTGDYPTQGFAGRPKPVFDLDSVNTLKLVDNLNNGCSRPSNRGPNLLQATEFFAGAVVSPFKATEAEVMAQYYKLQKKIASGARFIITQLGYDARKFEELRQYMDLYNPDIPLIGNIFVLSVPIGKLMNGNMIPGCVVTDQMLSMMEAEKTTGGNNKELQLLRAAKLYGLLKGLKYNGVNIGGHGLDYSDMQYIIEKGEELSLNWQDIIEEFHYPQHNGFYFFEKDKSTGLNTNKPVNRAETGSTKRSLSFSFFSLIHRTFFDQKSLFFPIIRSIAQRIDKSFLRKPFTYFEYITKKITNDCQFCGDCVIHELGFICPMSQCPKQQRNGACGGSRDGWCEVYPEQQKCIYVTMYALFKTAERDQHMTGKQVPPCNWELYKTSSWLNYFNNRDYNCNKRQ